MEYLEYTKCPLCDKWVYGDYPDPNTGGLAHNFVWRMDLGSCVCLDCNRELGIDNARLHAMKLSNDPTIAERYIAQYVKA